MVFKHINYTAFLVFFLIQAFSLNSETTKDHAVFIKVETDTIGTPKIKLSWDYGPKAKGFEIKRKLKNELAFESQAILPDSITYYIDSNIKKHTAYEYYVLKSVDSNYSAHGYVYAGIDIPFNDSRGNLLLLVDRTIAKHLEKEIETFMRDIAGDGWNVIRVDMPRTEKFDYEAVTRVKKTINDYYYSLDKKLNGLILLGRIAVPYSGTYAVDGHIPQHYGAWPCDAYYGVFDDSWTDYHSKTLSAERKENHNVPFDGKFDQTNLIDFVKFPIGRIDFFKLPNFKETEIELFKRYLRKNHDYRNRAFNIRKRAYIDDGFGMYTNEAFASMAWFNFSSLVGQDSIETGNYYPKLETEDYLWSYACNQGSYNSMLSTVYTDQLSKLQSKSIFTIFFGSYLGDWDSEDNLMRAALASQPYILTCIWGGRPYWYLHHMSLGETIGYQTMITQNNDFTYQSSSKNGNRGGHIALIGDPTLRQDMIAPPSNPQVRTLLDDGKKKTVEIKWLPSADSVDFYSIYKSGNLYSGYKLLKNISSDLPSIIMDTINSDSNYIYMIRACRMEKAVSGTYLNKSQGAFADIDGIVDIGSHQETENLIFPNPASKYVNYKIKEENDIISVEILNMQGILLNKINILPIIQNNLLKIELSDFNSNELENGIYFFKINFKTDSKIYKIIKIDL